MKEASYWHVSDDGNIECDLCPRRCRLKEGQRGACSLRRRVGDTLIADSYGVACGLAVDPIEKKPLAHFLPGSRTLSFGTTGCNLACKFCQNASLSRADKPAGIRVLPEHIPKMALEQNCKSVAFTYNEPTIFFEYAVDTAKACHQYGLKTVAVTNGWIEPEPRKEFYDHIDAANVDLKAFTDRFYRELCGATLQPVLDTLVYLHEETDIHLEVTTLLIPEQNDSPAEIHAMTKWAVANLGADVPWHFSAYRPTPHWHDAPPTPKATLLTAKKIAKANGLTRVHLGNLGIML